MARIRSFAAPHKGLRNIMGKFSFCLGYTNFADPSQLDYLKQVGHELFILLNDHVHTENEHTLTHLEERVKGASAHDKADHERLEAVQESLQQQLSGFTGEESADDIHLFYLNFSHFHSQYLEHIFEEETVTEALLQQHFTDEELIQQRTLTMQRIKFPTLLLWLKYIIPAQDEKDNVNMLSGLKANAPTEAFEQVLAVIKNEMDANRFQRLLATLNGD